MSVPRKMQEFAAIYGCEIEERQPLNPYEDKDLYAVANDNGQEAFICTFSHAHLVDLNKIKGILERVSGRTLAQFWTGR